MTDTTRDLLISLASHMAYMQGQLEAHHKFDDPEDYYWYRKSVLLRQKVTDVLLADEPAVPEEGREPAAVTGQPSDQELLELMPEQFRRDLVTVSSMAAHGAGTGFTPGLFRVSLNTGALDYARAVLARWGNHPAPPADGEVAECTAELLQRQVLVLVAVSERLPGPEDCVPHPRTKRGNWCWGFERCEVSLARPARWRLMHMETVEMEASHWLPAHALPLPEVNND